MPQIAMSREVLIAIVVVAIVVLLVAVYAIARGRGFRFTAQRGDTKLEMGVPEKQETPTSSSKDPGSIIDTSVLNQGKIQKSDVTIHIGHSIEKKKD